MSIITIDLDSPTEYEIHRALKVLEVLGAEVLEVTSSYNDGLHIIAEVDRSFVDEVIKYIEDMVDYDIKKDIEYALEFCKRNKISDPISVARVLAGDDLGRVLSDENKINMPTQVLFTEYFIYAPENYYDNGGADGT